MAAAAQGRLALRGSTYEIKVSGHGEQLTLQLEDCTTRQSWTGSFASNCACAATPLPCVR